MKKLLLILPICALFLAGCGDIQSTIQGVTTGANMIGAAQGLNQDVNNVAEISSDDNVNNILTIMNYQGTDKEGMKQAIKSGIEDGKKQGELNKEVVISKELGAGYLLGYTFGCKAATGDEQKCATDMGTKYQTIMMAEIQKQRPAGIK